jgi:hypothetical protein
MNKIFILFFIAVLSVSLVFAQPNGRPNGPPVVPPGSIDTECRNHGFDFGIVKFEWNEESYEPEDPAISPWVVNVWGNAETAYWTATPAVAGVISKEALNSYVHSGGVEGEISKSGQFDISHLTFCGNEPEDEIPEFSVIGALAVIGLAGLFIARKR